MVDREPGWLGRLAFGVGSEAAAHNPDLSDEDRVRLRRQARWVLPALLGPVLIAVGVAWAASRNFLIVITAAFVSTAAMLIVGLPIAVLFDRRGTAKTPPRRLIRAAPRHR